jgi:hypothetical protein
MYLSEKQFNSVFCATAFIEGKHLFFYPLIFFSYYARVPLNSAWRTTDGMHTTVWETLL